MNMNWLESLIYGLISGISEFLPISSAAHQEILQHLFGIETRDPVRDLFVHIAMLLAVTTSCRTFLDLLKRESSNSRSRYQGQGLRAFHDWCVIRGAILPMLITMLLLRYIINLNNNLLITVLFLTINGVVLFLPERMVQGNKDARSMTALDSLLIGLCGACSVFSGISRIGCTYSVSVARGAAKRHALNWSLILSISALACMAFMDFISVFTVSNIHFWGSLLTYILSGIAAYMGSRISISVMRFLVVRPGNDSFAYYCWGAALLSFILYLTIG